MKPKTPPKSEIRFGKSGQKFIVYFVLIVSALLAVAPVYLVISISIRNTYSLYDVEELIPKNPTLDNYLKILTYNNHIFLQWFFNTAVVVLASTLIAMFFSTWAGYTFSKLHFPGRDRIFMLLLSTIMVPFPAIMIPIFLIFQSFHLTDTYPGLILPILTNVIPVFWMRQYISTLPTELLDSGRIDGCSELGIFARLILPMCKPALAVVGIYTFWNQWNAFLWPLIVTNSESMNTLTLGLASLVGEAHFATDWGLWMAGTALNIIPVLIVFLAFQKYFIKGMTMGAIKG